MTEPNPFQQAVATRTGTETLQDLLKKDAYRNRFEQVLGPRAPQFISSILSLGATMRDVEPKSVLAACAIAASLNLPIDKNLGYAWIVPYKKNGVKYGSFQLGYHGLINLAQRTAAYERLNAEAINAEAYKGRDAVGEPIIAWDAIDESKPVAGYAFAFKLTNGFIKTAYWSKEKVIAHAQRYSQSYRSGGDTPWQSHFDSMALKVVISNTLRKWGMLSVEMQGAFAEDHAVHRDLDMPAEFPDASDDIQRPRFNDDEAEAKAGLAPAVQADPAKRKPGRPKKSVTFTEPEPELSTIPLEPGPKQMTSPSETEGGSGAVTPVGSVPAPSLEFGEKPIDLEILKSAMQKSGINEAEVLGFLKHRQLIGMDAQELAEVPTNVLADARIHWNVIEAQVRLNRKANAK